MDESNCTLPVVPVTRLDETICRNETNEANCNLQDTSSEVPQPAVTDETICENGTDEATCTESYPNVEESNSSNETICETEDLNCTALLEPLSSETLAEETGLPQWLYVLLVLVLVVPAIVLIVLSVYVCVFRRGKHSYDVNETEERQLDHIPVTQINDLIACIESK